MRTKRESFKEFKERIGGFSRRGFPEGETLITNEKLLEKADRTGRLIPYMGSTVLYMLSEEAQQEIACVQEALYGQFGRFFAERLSADQMHITLHDLISGPPSSWILKSMMNLSGRIDERIEQIKRRHENIVLRSTYLFSMVGTSLVWGFEPIDDENYRKLMDAYESVDKIVKLNYPLTPHITVAYFKPGIYEDISVIQPFIDSVHGKKTIEIALTPEMLGQYFFFSMNDYQKA